MRHDKNYDTYLDELMKQEYEFSANDNKPKEPPILELSADEYWNNR